MRIIVTGASGRTTRKAIDQLLARGVPAKDLILPSRSPERPELDKYRRLGADLRYGDFTDPASLPLAFAGGEKMFLMPLNHTPDEVDEPATISQAIAIAAKAGIRHIVYQWAATIFIDDQGKPYPNTDHPGDLKVEEALKASGMAWTVLRQGGFAESLGRECRVIIREGVLPTNAGNDKRGWVTRDDIAAAAVESLLGQGHDGKIYNVVGPEVGVEELAKVLSELSGKKIEVVVAKDRGWIKGGRTPPSDLPKLLGRPGQSVLDQLRDNREELLHGIPRDPDDIKFGFQWQVRGQESRPDDLGLRLNRLFKAAGDGDNRAAIEFGYTLGENSARHAAWRQTHPEWFAWENTKPASAHH